MKYMSVSTLPNLPCWKGGVYSVVCSVVGGVTCDGNVAAGTSVTRNGKMS